MDFMPFFRNGYKTGLFCDIKRLGKGSNRIEFGGHVAALGDPHKSGRMEQSENIFEYSFKKELWSSPYSLYMLSSDR